MIYLQPDLGIHPPYYEQQYLSNGHVLRLNSQSYLWIDRSPFHHPAPKLCKRGNVGSRQIQRSIRNGYAEPKLCPLPPKQPRLCGQVKNNHRCPNKNAKQVEKNRSKKTKHLPRAAFNNQHLPVPSANGKHSFSATPPSAGPSNRDAEEVYSCHHLAEVKPASSVEISNVGMVLGGTAVATSPANRYIETPGNGDRGCRPENGPSPVPQSSPLGGLSATTMVKKGGVAVGSEVWVAPPPGQGYGPVYSRSGGSGSGGSAPRGELLRRRGLSGGDGVGAATRGRAPTPNVAKWGNNWTDGDGPVASKKPRGEERMRIPSWVAGARWSSHSGCGTWPADAGDCGRGKGEGRGQGEEYAFDGSHKYSLLNPGLSSTQPMSITSIPMPSAEVACWRRENANKIMSPLGQSPVSITLTPELQDLERTFFSGFTAVSSAGLRRRIEYCDPENREGREKEERKDLSKPASGSGHKININNINFTNSNSNRNNNSYDVNIGTNGDTYNTSVDAAMPMMVGSTSLSPPVRAAVDAASEDPTLQPTGGVCSIQGTYAGAGGPPCVRFGMPPPLENPAKRMETNGFSV